MSPVELEARARQAAPAPDHSVDNVLRLLGTGAGGPIVMALGPGPLRTKQLTKRVQEFSSRSVYRHVSNLRAHCLVERHEEPGVPSTVVLSLTDPLGRNLYRLLRKFAVGDARWWDSLRLLGEMWGLGFVEKLSHRPRSLNELTNEFHEMTYHQVNRRGAQLVDSGLLAASSSRSNGKIYELTDEGRRRMALVTGIGRWRLRNVPASAPGLTIGEMATVLRAALPLASLPGHAGMSIALTVAGPADEYGSRRTEMVRGTVGRDGTLRCDQEEGWAAVAGSAAATVNTWFAALLDGNRGRIRVRGDLGLVDACLTQLYERLWIRS
jgi:DNA-binding HxlR family transcriptional regulator